MDKLGLYVVGSWICDKGLIMWAPIKELGRRNECFMACEGYKPSFPLSRVQKFKFFLFGLLHRIGHNR